MSPPQEFIRICIGVVTRGHNFVDDLEHVDKTLCDLLAYRLN